VIQGTARGWGRRHPVVAWRGDGSPGIVIPWTAANRSAAAPWGRRLGCRARRMLDRRMLDRRMLGRRCRQDGPERGGQRGGQRGDGLGRVCG